MVHGMMHPHDLCDFLRIKLGVPLPIQCRLGRPIPIPRVGWASWRQKADTLGGVGGRTHPVMRRHKVCDDDLVDGDDEPDESLISDRTNKHHVRRCPTA